MVGALALAAALGLTGCNGTNLHDDSLGGANASGPTVLIASPAYVRDGADGQARLGQLRAALDDLRSSTGSGWTGRQDDVTGYLADLSGGRYFAEGGADAPTVVRSLMDVYGDALFGIGAGQLALADMVPGVGAGSGTIRATQELDGVPVLDGVLVFTLGDTETDPRVTAARGRVFGDLEVSTSPTLGAGNAARAAERLSGGGAQGRPTLVVLPDGGGDLAWEVTVVGATKDGDGLTLADGRYYISAVDGSLLAVRDGSVDGRTPVAYAPQAAVAGVHGIGRLSPLSGLDPVAGTPVEVTGDNPIGGTMTANGVQTPDGVVLVDTTTPTYDPATGKGGIYTYTAGDSDDQSRLPGQLYADSGTTINDPEALAAQALSRVVYDFYAALGRASWDGQGASMVSTVNFGDGNFCNSFFSGDLDPPQMIYGNPCAPGGDAAELTEVEVDTAGHEITHGVTDTSAGLIYSGQSGALNESFSDYFGNVIGNKLKGSDTAELFEGGCIGFTDPTAMCRPNPEGGLSLRYMLNGNTMDDYLYVLNAPQRLRILGLDTQDKGGVHLNSAIWNNALWSIRSRLAQIDGLSGNESPLAADFDKIVYAALTTQLGPSAGFLDARAAIEQTTVDAQADPTILRVVQEVFDQNDICDGCAAPESAPGLTVSSSPQTQLMPVVAADRIAWLDLNQGDGVFGFPATSKVGGSASNLSTSPDTIQVGFAGEALVAIELPGSVVRYDTDGGKTKLADIGTSTLVAGLAGSDDGAAWQSSEDGTVSYVDAAGKVTTADLPDLGGDNVVSIGTGGGTVGLGTERGRVLRWQPGGDFQELGRMDGAVLATAAYGDRVLGVDDAGHATAFGPGGAVDVSDSAIPFGAAVTENYVVWTNAIGELGGGVARTEGASYPDTDLYLWSPGSGTIYDLLPERGQQGFPSMSGDRIVWQDSVLGGDDIFTATIPSGL
ncbi:MAG: Zn-dependent metalloprotease [Nocardioides sp.]|nr:Zn-dependent metalloprotease [Nocardioides sp.]